LAQGVGIGNGVLVNPNVSIGAFTYINQYASIYSGSVGSFCSIAASVQIGAENHPTNFLSTSPRFFDPSFNLPNCPFEKSPAPPNIGSDVWIGVNAVVMQGVSIGHGAIIGAGAVVTRDVPPYAVAVGVPARVTRFRFEPSLVAWLLKLEWWDRSPDDLQELSALFEAGSSWIELTGLASKVEAD